MDKEYVYGYEISVVLYHGTENDFNESPFKRKRYFNSTNEGSSSSSSSRDSSSSPTRDTEMRKTDINDLSCSKFDFPPPPVLDSQTFPSLFKNSFSPKKFPPQSSSKSMNMFPAPPNIDVLKDKKFQLDWNISKALSHPNNTNRDFSAFSPFKKEIDSRTKFSPKNVGRVTPFLMQECDKNGQSPSIDPGGIRSSSNRIENTTSSYMFPNHNFQNSGQNVGSSFDIQHINESYFFPSSWSGVNTMSDSALSITRNGHVSSFESSSYVELHVSNLDPAFEVNEMKRILLAVFREHVMVLHISMSLQPDGGPKATVKVPSLQDAQFAISRLHRKKIGHKRILISHVSSNKIPPFHILKSETIALLSDIPNKSLPLIKFRELYEKRYHRPIAVSELYKMRDAVSIQGDSGSRVVFLNSEYCNTPSLTDSEDSQDCNIIERPYCEVHFHVAASQGWEEQYNICPLPLVHISLKILATAVHRLLDSHQGSLPLISFCDCYEAEIGLLPIVGTFEDESIEVSSGANQPVSRVPKGVPLEHLIACIAGVEVAKSVLCIKKVQWLENRNDPQAAIQNFSPALVGQLTLFGREVMDLLKSQPQCLVQFNKFIPTYHHHFGRQCRVADYGFTKLIDLLEAIPHIVQVLGEGQNRQVTLTHRTQVRRFAGELLRILKSRASKQIIISEFAQAYEQVTERPFEITNYGVCEIEDMISEVPENVIITTGSGIETVISIPKREQTSEEIERTKQFADEVVELMKHTTNCSMSFNKFIPSYHHHFGKQCRVADYGFTKLIELFEVIPNVLEVKGTGEDKVLKLVESEQHKILLDRLVTVLQAQSNEVVEVTQLPNAYIRVHGHALRPSEFGFSNLEELLENFNSSLKVINFSGRTYVCLVNHELIKKISMNIRKLLMEQKNGKMLLKDLYTQYQMRFQQNIDIVSFLCDLTGVVQVSNGFIQLAPLQLLARDVIVLLQEYGNQLPLSSLGTLFQQKYGVSLCVSDYGFQSMSSTLEHFPDYFVLKGKRQKRFVCLTSEISDLMCTDVNRPLFSVTENSKNIDLLNEPVPSTIPKPTLKPHVDDRFSDLMGFETPPVHGVQPSDLKLAEGNLTIPNLRISESEKAKVTADESYENSSSTPFACSSTQLDTLSSIALQSFSTSCDESEEATTDFKPKIDMPIHSKQDSSKCFHSTHPSKFEIKLDIKFENSNLKSSQKHNGFEHLEHIVKSSINPYSDESSSFDVVTEYNDYRTKDDVESTKSTPTNEKKISRRNRIAAQFSSPINE